MIRLLRSIPKVRPAGMLQYSIAYREECVWKRLSVLNAKGGVVAFTTVLLTPLLPSCVYTAGKTRFTRGRVRELKNSHKSVTVPNRTHVYMNFFDHKDLGNHLLQ